MGDKKEISFETLVTREKVAGYLQNLAESISSGKLNIQKGIETIALTPGETVAMEVEAKQKKEKEKFSLKLTWTVSPEQTLKITPD